MRNYQQRSTHLQRARQHEQNGEISPEEIQRNRERAQRGINKYIAKYKEHMAQQAAISSPDDANEKEADEVARKVSEGDGSAISSQFTTGNKEIMTKKADEEKPKIFAGDLEGKKLVRIAWTIDDGPGGFRKSMLSAKGLGNLKAVTWYIQRNMLKGQWEHLAQVQADGGEMAIHSFHPTETHSTWFPISSDYIVPKNTAYHYPYANSTESDIMKDLASFDAELKAHSIKAKFVRLPGGLRSELRAYVMTLRKKYNKDASTHYNKDSKEPFEIADAIIAGKDISGYGAEAAQAKADFDTLKATLSKLDLILWGGGNDPMLIKPQSWEAESSGVKGRADNVTEHVSGPRQGIDKGGRFEALVNGMKDGDTRSMVVLSHENSEADVTEVNQDISTMEKFAKANGVKIQYCTMSELFQLNTGENPATFDVDYK